MFLSPFCEISYPKIIFIIKQKLIKACFCHIRQLYFCLCRSCGCFAPFSDILLARAGGLYHLIYSSVTFVKEMMSKVISDIINNLGNLICYQIPISTFILKKRAIIHDRNC